MVLTSSDIPLATTFAHPITPSPLPPPLIPIIPSLALLLATPRSLQAGSTDREVEAWRLDGSVGRRYGLINGDLNPIHL